MNFWLGLITVLLMLVGLAGVVIPLLPGLPLIFLAYLLYGFITDWQSVTPAVAVVMGALAFFSFGFDFLSTAWGAKKYGASKSGVWGSILGGLLGVVVFGFSGLILGPMVGAFIGELVDGKPHPLAAQVTIGSLLGLLAGSFVKIIIGTIMIGIFLWQIL